MASVLSEEQFMCCICLDFFRQPVSIPCGHNFCLACIQGFWNTSDRSECPLCKERFRRRPDLRINRALADITESFKQSLRVSQGQNRGQESGQEERRRVKEEETLEGGKQGICTRHRKPLDVFCRTEQAIICSRCAEGQHRGHQMVPLEREATRMKAELQNSESKLQQMIQERLEKVEEIGVSVQLSKKHMEKEIEQSNQVFTALLHSIERSKDELVEELREKQREVERKAASLSEELHKEIIQLVAKKSELEQLMNSEDKLHLLQNFPSVASPPRIKDWTQSSSLTAPCVGTARRAVSKLEEILRNQEKNLCEAELRQIRQHQVDVTFDPNTSAPWVVLSSDLKRASLGVQPDPTSLPGPLRFDSCVCVLGRPGITTGRCYWAVHVGDKTDWDLGVARESINRKGAITVRPGQGFWAVSRRNGEHLNACAGPSVPLVSLSQIPQKVGVFVDYEEGLVSFYDTESRSHIYTYTGCAFRETLYPYFNPCLHNDGKNIDPLVICSVSGEVRSSGSEINSTGRSASTRSRQLSTRSVTQQTSI